MEPRKEHDKKRISLYISRTQCDIMRGLAIVFIMLHNYLHLVPDVLRENQFQFNDFLPKVFFDKLFKWSPGIINDYFSFLGWYGIAVFVFLTGYGLVRKYERSPASERFSRGAFVYNNWLKLLNLMLPGVIILLLAGLAGLWLIPGEYMPDILKTLSLLSFLNDPLLPWLGVTPGVYWYFGLTLELYIVYALAVKGRRPWLLWALVVLTVLLQAYCLKCVDSLIYGIYWVRHNFTGWLLVFAFGVAYARRDSAGRGVVAVVVALSFLLFFPCLLDPLSCLLTPLCAVVVAMCVAVVSSHIRGWAGFWAWTGRLSPYLFAAHPLVRMLFYGMSADGMPQWLPVAMFIAGSYAGALLYRLLWRGSSALVGKVLPPRV